MSAQPATDPLNVNVVQPLTKFAKDSYHLFMKCTKPDRKGAYRRVCCVRPVCVGGGVVERRKRRDGAAAERERERAEVTWGQGIAQGVRHGKGRVVPLPAVCLRRARPCFT